MLVFLGRARGKDGYGHYIVKVWDSQCSESVYLYAEWTPGCVSYVKT